MRPVLRWRAAECHYTGCEKGFYLGTVQAESEMEALQKLPEMWANISPHPFPDHVVAIPGMVIFHPEQKDPDN